MNQDIKAGIGLKGLAHLGRALAVAFAPTTAGPAGQHGAPSAPKGKCAHCGKPHGVGGCPHCGKAHAAH